MAQTYAKNQPAGFKNRLENIAFVGAGGRLGRWITEELLKNKRFTVTALTRKGSKSNFPPGIKRVKVDYDDESSLVEAMKGQDCLITLLGVQAPKDASKKLFEAAAKAGVSWIVPNDFGSDASTANAGLIGPQKKADRDIIERLGVSSWIGIATMYWYEFSLSGWTDRLGFDFDKKSVLFFDDGTTRIHMSTFPQVARGTAAILGLKIYPEDEDDKGPTLDEYRNEFFHLKSFYINQREIFDSVLRVTGDKPGDWKQSSKKVQDIYTEGEERLKKGDRWGLAVMMYSRTFHPDTLGNYPKEVIDNERLGLPQEDLDEFTKVAIQMSKNGYHSRN